MMNDVLEMIFVVVGAVIIGLFAIIMSIVALTWGIYAAIQVGLFPPGLS